jgi:hypothetical protein
MPKIRICFALAALLTAAALLGIGAGTATAGKTVPCWKLVQNDEYDGRIDGTYELHCYREAIAKLPQDSVIYGAARKDIIRAMESAITKLTAKGVKVGPHTKLPPAGGGKRGLSQHKRHKGVIAAIADKIGPGNASSIPLPLLILAGLGLLLVAAAGASYTARWIAARRAQPAPATSPPTPRRK